MPSKLVCPFCRESFLPKWTPKKVPPQKYCGPKCRAKMNNLRSLQREFSSRKP